MSRIELQILYKEGDVSKLRCTVNKWKFNDAMMGEQYLTFTITSEKPIDWAVGDYCVFRGETFTLNYIPSVTQKAGTKERQDAYTYENVKFDSFLEELTRCQMLDITATTGEYVAAQGRNYTGSSKFTLFCGETSANGTTLTAVCVLVAKMQANLDRMYPTNGWKIFVDTTSTYVTGSGSVVLVTHTEDKVMSFDNWSVAQALAEVHNTFDLDYCVRGRNIYIGYNLKNLTSDNEDETFAFGYGKGYNTREDMNHGLFQIKRVANSQQQIVTRLRALGSTKNMPYRYYNKKYGLFPSLFPTNLQLPDTFATPATKAAHNAQRDQSLAHVKGDTNDAYIDKGNDAAACKEGIREASVRFDGSNSDLPEIYPTIEEATYGELRGALVQDQSGRTGSGSFPNYGDSERIDKILAVGYYDNDVLVDDANKDNGILPESGIDINGVTRSASIGMTNLNYNTRNNGSFNYVDGVYRGAEKTLFTIQGVAPGKYGLAPTHGGVVKYGFNLSCYKDGCGCDVGYIIRVKAKNVQTGIITDIATYNSDFTDITSDSGIKEVELPELPDVKEDTPKVSEISVVALSDIIVTFTPVIKSITVPQDFTDNFSINYQVGKSLVSNESYAPEYTWFPIAESDTLTDTFHVFVQDMGFDFEACWSDETPKMAMKSGRCVGREFEIGSDVQKVTYGGKQGYMLTLKRAQDSSLNTYYPSQTAPIAAGDHFVLLGIQMPDVYVQMAEVRLLRAATDYLADNCETKFTYQPSIDDIYLQRNLDLMREAGKENDSIFWRLYAGLKFTFRGIPTNENNPAPLAEITIEKVTISMGESLTPKVELTLNDDVQQGTIQKLTTSVDRIYNGSIFSGGSGNGATGAVSAAMLSILQSEGDKLFLSKVHDDTAAGKITFEDTVTFEESAKARKGVVVGRFQSGLLGNGALIDEEGNAEFNSIFSRNFISTPEFRFNRVNVTEGENWCTNGFGTIQNVEIIDDTTGYIDLKLEENDYTSIQVGDICRGIYNDIANQYETKTLDDDSELYEDIEGESEEEDSESNGVKTFGFSSKVGFFTSYFFVKKFITNKRGECRFLYELRNAKTPHPCEFMKFAQYGSFTNSERRSSSYSTSIGHYYEMVLDGVSTWKIHSANVVYRKGYLGNMFVTLKNGKEAQLQGYGLYVQDNVYFGNAVVQLDPETLKDLENSLNNYTVDFSNYADVITVDDVGNAIGGLYTVSGENNEYKDYRIHSAITVRKSGKPLVIAEDNADAREGTYKIYAEAHGCSFVIENSTIFITGIDNIKDGVAGSSDDEDFDYEAMRNTDVCSIDFIIDCEGNGSIQKNFPIRIKHDSQPYIGADISNEFSAVSWNTKTQRYIGLPITFEMKMWHNNEPLDIASVNDIAVTPTISGMTVSKSIATKSNGAKVAVVSITALPTDLPLVTDLNVTCVATYSGVPYERTLVHTINKTTDTNVYSLLPSVSEIVIDKNKNTLSENSITCKVVCDSSDDKHYEVAFTDFATHKLAIYYRKFYTDGTSDSAETLYNNTAIPVASNMSEIRFYLYGLKNGTVDKTIIQDSEGVAVIADGLDGKGVEYIFITKNDWDGTDANMPTINDVASERQVDDYCPYTDAQHTDQWTAEPSGIGINQKFEFYAQRKKVNGVWQPFSDVKLWDRYALDGQSPYMIDLTNEQSFVNFDEDGTVISSYEASNLIILKGNSYVFTDFYILITPTNIKCNGFSSAFYLTDEQKASAQSNGFFTLTPSELTANSGQISIQAQLKSNTNIVFVAVYKINKNLAGKDGVIYSLIPSLNVINKNADGTYRDVMLDVQVNKIVGPSVTELTTKSQLTAEGISLFYQGSHLVEQEATTLTGLPVSTLCGTSLFTKLFLRKINNNTLLDSERINVVSDGEDGHDVNPNILLDTAFFSDRTKWFHLNGSVSSYYQGRAALYSNPNGISSDNNNNFERIAEQLICSNSELKLSVDTWYTFSVYCKGSGIFALLLLQAGGYIDSSFYLDGTNERTFTPYSLESDLYAQVSLTNEWTRHYITFKTKSSFDTSLNMYISTRLMSINGNAHISMMKLEEGQYPTGYMANEEDTSGIIYYLTASPSTLLKDSSGNFKGGSRPVITAWKKKGKDDAVKLSTITDATGTVADGMTITAQEIDSSSNVLATYSSTHGELTCYTPDASTVRIDVAMTKNNKTYAVLAIPIIQEVKGDSGEPGVYPRDRGLFQTGESYIYQKSGDMYIRDMVRYEIGNIMYGFLVKNKNATVVDAPTSESGDSNWESAGIVKTVIANTIFGANANVGGFMASAERLRSSSVLYRVVYKGTYNNGYYKYTTADGENDGIPKRDMVKYDTAYYVILHQGSWTNSDGKTVYGNYIPADNTYMQPYYPEYWRRANAKEMEAVVQDSNGNDIIGGTVDFPMFELNGNKGVIRITQSDETSWHVDTDGKQTVGQEDGQRVEISPLEKKISIFDADNKQVAQFDGDNVATIDDLFGNSNGSLGGTNGYSGNHYEYAPNSNWHSGYIEGIVELGRFGAITGTITVVANGRISAQGNRHYNSSFYDGDPASILIGGVPSPIQVDNSYLFKNHVIGQLVIGYYSGGKFYKSSILAEVTAFGDYQNREINVSKSFTGIGTKTYYLAISYKVGLYYSSQNSGGVTWNGIKASYAGGSYLSRVFANGFVYGLNGANFMAAIAENTSGSTNMHIKAMSGGGLFGFEVTKDSIYITISGKKYKVTVSGTSAVLTEQ